MAIELLSALSGALSIQFQKELDRQFNRFDPLFTKIQKKTSGGPNLTWDVRFSRATSATNISEGADVAAGDIQQDITVPAVLNWGIYRSVFGMSGLSVSAAMTAANSPQVLMEKFRGQLEDAASDLANKISTDLYTGTGTGTAIAGLQGAGALLATGTYAGISRVSYPEWAGNTAALAGALTLAALNTQERAIFNRCGMKPTMIVTTADIADAYAGLFSTVVQNAPIGSPLSTPEQTLGSWDVNGFTGLVHKGIPIFRSAKCPAGQLYMLNEEYLSLESLPYFLVGDEVGGAQSQAVYAAGQANSQTTGLNAKVEALGKTGDSAKFQVVCYVQQKERKPLSSAVITGIV